MDGDIEVDGVEWQKSAVQTFGTNFKEILFSGKYKYKKTFIKTIENLKVLCYTIM